MDEKDLKQEIEIFKNEYLQKDSSSVKSEEFTAFRKNLVPFHFTLYEKACNFCEHILTIKADKKKQEPLREALETCHINTTPAGVSSLAILGPMAFILFGTMLTFILSFFLGGGGMMFFIITIVILGIAAILPLSNLPFLLANQWRMKASNQMVLSIFYVVSFMRHTSNLELAIKFTSDHLAPPLSIDFKKILWDVEAARFNSVKESLEHYLGTWKKYNGEFVESMHLVISSLYESSEEDRIGSLEKALSLILESTYEKMLHYAQDLKSPITMLHMLGVILPILGLVILPLVVSFMEGVKWYHIGVLYNIFLPLIVFYYGRTILSTRPTGYGQASITEVNPELKKHQYITIFNMPVHPKWISFIVFLFFACIALLPIIVHTLHQGYFDIIWDDGLMVIRDAARMRGVDFAFLHYKVTENGIIGPYGLGATLFSLALPFGLALAIGLYYKYSTQKLVKIRKKTKELEEEFASTLFQLGNRIGDGLPAEIAFTKVAQITENTVSGKFFQLVAVNIASLGMGVEEAIFNPKYGAITKFPSALIESSMKVFIESVKKGPEVASKSLLNISTYIKEMHRVDERLKDLMSEITSSMRSQINFLAPLISGIVIGLTSMITSILNKLGDQLSAIESSGTPSDSPILGLFGDSIPTYYFQIIVGLYVVQIIYLLTTMLNTIQNGYDPLAEKDMLSKNVLRGGSMYTVIATIVIILFNMIALVVISEGVVI